MGPGNQNNAVDYYSDYLFDPIIQTKSIIALTPALIDWLSRFSTLLPAIKPEDNFFVSYQVSMSNDEEMSIEKVSIENHYSDKIVYLRAVSITNGQNCFPKIYKDIQMSHGFGSAYNVPEFPISIDPRFPTEIEIYAMCIGCMNTGQGYYSWPFRYSVFIPAFKER